MANSIDASRTAITILADAVLRRLARSRVGICYYWLVVMFASASLPGAAIAEDATGRDQQRLVLEFAFVDGPRQEIAIAEESPIDVATSTSAGRLRVSGHVGRVVDDFINVRLDVNWMLHSGGGGGPLCHGQIRLGQFQGVAMIMPAVVALDFLWIRRGTDPIPTLIEALQHEDAAVAAAQYLGGLGEVATPAVLQLAAALDPKHSTRLREVAAEALGKIGPGAKAAVSRLTELLQQEETSPLRIRLAVALWQVAKHTDAIAALSAALDDSDRSVRLTALDALVEIGVGALSAAALVSMLEDRDARIRAGAAEALWATTRDPRAVDVLVDILERDKVGYERAAQALGHIGYPAAQRAADALALHVFSGREPSGYVVKALVLIDPDGSQTLPVVLRVVRENNVQENLQSGSEALARFGPMIVPRMRDLLNAEDEAARDLAFYTLWRIGAPAVATLGEALRHRDPQIRRDAATWLRDIETANSAVIPDLARALRDDVDEVRQEAALTLTHIGPPAVAALTQLQEDSDAVIRQGAASVLQQIQERSEKE